MTPKELAAIRERDKAWVDPLRTIESPEEMGRVIRRVMEDRRALLVYVGELLTNFSGTAIPAKWDLDYTYTRDADGNLTWATTLPGE